MKSLYIRRFRPGRRFTEKLDPNLINAGKIPAEKPESIGENRFIKYLIILKSLKQGSARAVPRYPSKFWKFGYRWVPGTGKILKIGYRWVPGTRQILEIGYRWVPGTEQISEVGYR